MFEGALIPIPPLGEGVSLSSNVNTQSLFSTWPRFATTRVHAEISFKNRNSVPRRGRCCLQSLNKLPVLPISIRKRAISRGHKACVFVCTNFGRDTVLCTLGLGYDLLRGFSMRRQNSTELVMFGQSLVAVFAHARTQLFQSAHTCEHW